MRIVHTADWHLGKMFYGDYLTDDQSYILHTQFLPLLKEEHIDAVVLAGDVYDRSLPPADAVTLFDEITTTVTKDLGIPFFVISGNHDSATRLSFGSRILEREGLYIEGDLMKLRGPVILFDTYGPVAFVLVPYAEPVAVRHLTGDDSIRDHEDALKALCHIQSKGTETMRTICVAHAFVGGGITSDSERPLSIGGTELVGAQLFDSFTYTALGHLHGPQQIGSDHTRYAGSLMKYSFSEAHQKKGALIVDIDEKGAAETQFIPFTPHHDLRIVTGSFASIMERHDAAPEDFILARIEDTEPILDGMARLRQKYPNALSLEAPNRQSGAIHQDRAFNLHEATEQQLFEGFSQAMRPEIPLTEDERDCLKDMWNELLRREGEGLL